jgi:hypothetical protein
MRQTRRRSALPIALLGVAVVAGILWWGARDRARPPGRAGAPAVPGTAQRGNPDASAPGATSAPAAASARTSNGRTPPFDLPDTPWAAVDLERVRAAMPENLYWKLSSPTKDEAVIRERQEERARWNEQYGKVLSNTATAEEIDAYYAHQHRLSSDYVEFATYLLVEFGEELPDQDAGLLKLAVELNLARLEEIPRRIADAHERRKAHDAARRAWLEEQKAFDEKISR